MRVLLDECLDWRLAQLDLDHCDEIGQAVHRRVGRLGAQARPAEEHLVPRRGQAIGQGLVPEAEDSMDAVVICPDTATDEALAGRREIHRLHYSVLGRG